MCAVRAPLCLCLSHLMLRLTVTDGNDFHGEEGDAQSIDYARAAAIGCAEEEAWKRFLL